MHSAQFICKALVSDSHFTTFFCSMLIKQLMNLRKARPEILKFRTDLRHQAMGGWSVLLCSTINDCFPGTFPYSMQEQVFPSPLVRLLYFFDDEPLLMGPLLDNMHGAHSSCLVSRNSNAASASASAAVTVGTTILLQARLHFKKVPVW